MKRILLVDDNATNAYYLQALLTAHGHLTDSARNGAEALAKARETRPDLVISDLLMPVMDGYTLLRHWRTDDALARVPFIVYSATYTEDADERLALDFGADAFLRKPAAPEEIMACVEAHLGREADRSPRPDPAEHPAEGDLMKLYSERLVRKLEKKSLELEFANQTLQTELEERRRIEALQRSQSLLLASAQRIARMGSWSHEVASGRLTWSDATCELFGIDPAQFERQPEDFYRHVLEADRPAVRAAVAGATPSDPAIETEYRIRRGDGEVRWMFARGTVEYDEAGSAVRLLGMVMDITERRAAEDALRISEERFRLLTLATSDAIWDWTLADGRLWRSEGIEAITGFRADELPPNRIGWEEHVHPDDRGPLESAIARVLAGESDGWSASYRFRRKDGSYAHVNDRGHAVRDASGEVVRMVGSIRDVSERHALEQQLRQSQRLDALGQLTGGVAHDFNNLLTVIQGYAEVLEAELSGTPQQALLEMISAAARTGSALTHRLLAFARRQALDPRATDVAALVRDMHAMLQRVLGEHIVVERGGGTAAGVALIDAQQLESALLNLCINARDAMPKGGRLRLETSNVELSAEEAARIGGLKAGSYVVLGVADTGVGIPREHLARVLEPFFTTKEKGKGTGLGLAMVYGFARQSGGQVQIESSPGVGTTVRLYLPATSNAQVAPAARDLRQAPAGGGERVLLVEDDELVRGFARSQLLGLGYEVTEADSGIAALEILRSDAPVDLLFTDVVMPGMSGPELVGQARSLRPGLRVLYTSGYARDAIIREGRLDSGDRLLSKPYRRAELALQVRAALDEQPD